MYRPPAFQEDRAEVLGALIRAHPLATLVTAGPGGLMANHLPFMLVETGAGPALRAHLARANPQLGELEAVDEALVVFQGPQAYVSPGWYATKKVHGKVVPTWNYMVVQARGRPRISLDADWLRAQVEALTVQQEGDLAEPWAVSDAPEDFVTAQLRAIAGLEIPVARIEGKWKISQNHPVENRAGVAEGLRALDPSSPMAEAVAPIG